MRDDHPWLGKVIAAICLACVAVTSSAAQRTAVRTIAVYSCPFGDSVLGEMKHRGAVTVWHDADSATFQVSTHDASRLLARLDRAGNPPVRWPAPDLSLIVEGKLGIWLLAERPRRPIVALILDDSVRLPLGEGGVGNYSGVGSNGRRRAVARRSRQTGKQPRCPSLAPIAGCDEIFPYCTTRSTRVGATGS